MAATPYVGLFADLRVKINTDAFKKADKAVNKTSKGISDFAKTLGVGLSFAGLSLLVKSTVDAADAVGKAATAAGLSVEAFQEWNFVAKLTGAKGEMLTKAMFDLNRAVGEAANGGMTQAKAFKELGVSWKELQGLNQEEQFERVRDALSKITDENKRARISQILMADGARQLGVILRMNQDDMKKTRDEAKRFGVTLTEDQANKAAVAADSMAKFGASVTKVKNALIFKYLPKDAKEFDKWLGDITDKFIELIEKTDLVEVGFLALGVAAAIAFPSIAAMALALGKVLIPLIAIDDLLKGLTGKDSFTRDGLVALFEKIGVDPEQIKRFKELGLTKGFNALDPAQDFYGPPMPDNYIAPQGPPLHGAGPAGPTTININNDVKIDAAKADAAGVAREVKKISSDSLQENMPPERK